MGVKPAGQASVKRGNGENHDLRARRIDAHRFGHQRTALQRTNRPPLARIKQVARGNDDEQQHCPDQVIKFATGFQLKAEELQCWNAGNTGVATKEIDVAKQIIEADSPGDGAEWQKMPGQTQRNQANRQGDNSGDGQTGRQGEPRGDAMHGCQIGGGVGAQTDKGGLPE